METEERGGGLLGGAVRRPVTLLVTMVALLVIGLIAYQRIPVEMMPDGIRWNGLFLMVSHPGSSAEENEAKVVRVIEEQIRTLSRSDEVSSTSSEDRATIQVMYDRGVDMALAKAELRDRIERARTQLPDTVDRIFVFSWDNSQMPLMWFAVLHPGDSDRTDYLIDTAVQRKLEAVDGVSRVEIDGMLDDSVRILLDEEKVKAAQLDIGALVGRLSRDNFAKPLGEVQDGGQWVIVRSDMRFDTLEEIEDYPIGRGQTLGDVGRVEKVKTVRERLSRINGQFAYFGEIGKESTANVVDTARRVKEALDELEQDPQIAAQDMKFLVLFSQGSFIEASLGQLRATAMWGGALAALVLLVFLRRVRVTICVALSIPISALLSLAWVYFTGGTFNVLTMTGITLGIGMLVDNSVVVIENIARLHGEGRPPLKAASEGVRDVGLAVCLATMTTVVVFLPLIFMTGNPVIRIMFGALGLPLCVSLLISLVVALVFLPTVAARIVGPRATPVERIAGWLTPIFRVPVQLVVWLLDGLQVVTYLLARVLLRGQRVLLAVLVPLRWVLAPALVAFAVWKLLQLQGVVGSVFPLFGPGMAPGETLKGLAGVGSIWIAAALAGAGLLFFGPKLWKKRSPVAPVRGERPSTLLGRGRALSFIDLMVTSNGRLLDWSMKHRLLASFLAFLAFLSVLIPRSNMTVAAFGEDENRGRIDVRIDLEDNFTLQEASEELGRYEELLDEHRPELAFDHISSRFYRGGGRLTLYWEEALTPEGIAAVRKRLKTIWPSVPGHRVRFYGDESLDTRNKAIVSFEILGPDAEVLNRLGEEAMERLEQIPGLSGISSPLEDAPQQVHVSMDLEKAWQLGVTANMALQNIAWALRGVQLPRFHEPGREVPFIIEYDEEEVAGLHTLRDLDIFTAEGVVALAAFADLDFEPGPRAIYRRNGQISHSIQGRVDDPNRQRQVSDAGYAALREMELPRGFSLGDEVSVAFREDQEMQEMYNALLLSVVLVFLLMAILFESVILPVCVLTTVPFAVAGAFWTLFMTGTTIDSVGWIGIIILVGVVVNNGIVLIDRIHRLHTGGMERTRAVLEGGASRVRPIVMTALTTVFGLMPMVLSEPPAEGIDYRALATCVAGGLAISTFFTLWVVPLTYTLVLDGRDALRAWSRFGLQRLVSFRLRRSHTA